MPFKWKKKTNREPASANIMKAAVKEVIDGSKLRATANKYSLDKMTLRRYVIKYREQGDAAKFSPNYKLSQIFDDNEEKRLAEYLLTAAKMNYGLTTKETRKLAYMYAVKNEKKIPANWDTNESASYEWLRGFMSRNTSLSLRTPEPTSLGRATAFNKHTVGEFYDLLRVALVREQYEPHSIYNCDETGVQTVHKPTKIISQKGQKQVSKATSGERGQTVTVCCAVNATGNSVPPFFIFPRVREQDYMTHGAPPGSRAVTHSSGWMTAENFERYLHHFIKFVKCSKEQRILLIADNHSSHISPRGLEICRDNGITLLTIPPHTSHRLQPLDVSVYGPFKAFFNQACDNFMTNNPGQTITLKDIASLVGIAHSRAFTPLNILKGFSKTGIYPFNPHIFNEQDFLTSSVTDRPVPSEREQVESQPGSSRQEGTSKPVPAQPGSSKEKTPEPVTLAPQPDFSRQEKTPEPLTSVEPQPDVFIQEGKLMETATDQFEPEPSLYYTSPEEIRPFPKALPRKTQTCGRKPVKTKILTDTPNFNEIKEDQINRQMPKYRTKVKRNIAEALLSDKVSKYVPARKNRKEKEIFEEDSESSVDISSATSSEEVTDLEDQLENNMEDDNFIKGVININDYVLVRFATKKISKYYVGRVLDIVGEEYYINFMRRKKPEYYFVYPDVPDQSFVTSEDVIKLPLPCFVGGTARSTRKLSFPINFDKFDNVN